MKLKFYALSSLMLLLCAVSLSAQNKTLTENQKEYFRELWKEKYHPAKGSEHGASSQLAETFKANGLGEMKVSSNTVTDEGEPFIMVNPNDSDNVVVSYMDLNNGLRFPIYYTLDGGNSWNLSNFNTVDSMARFHPTWTIAGGGDPVFAYDSNGRLYFSWLYLSQAPNSNNEDPMEMYWAWSDDKGQTWKMVNDTNDRLIGSGSLIFGGIAIGSAGDGIFDRQWMAVDRSG
ncbi:MAG TPA: hypothetical protein ENJ82_11270, partial [Bacteroidetes bacterium]|nr:hypothetical protein [Bacteroidota bacterium]